jgi:uncharacterized protein (TIGR02611 family)
MPLAPLLAVVRFVRRSGKRIAVTIVGGVLLLAGLVMMITPGPGVLVILAGLAVLASEYVWAQRALEKAREKGRGAVERGRGLVRKVRRKAEGSSSG